MCGRFTLSTPAGQLATLFDLPENEVAPAVSRPRYNIAPSQPVAIVRLSGSGKREAVRAEWGLIPHWSSDSAGVGRFPNARAETARLKPAFRLPAVSRRCLIPADGFYEWRDSPVGKLPYHIRQPDRGAFAFAGFWDRWASPAGKDVQTFTILTTKANDTLAGLHPRMPVILPPEAFEEWLDPQPLPSGRWAELTRSSPDDFLEVVPVSKAVNDARFDDAKCLEPRPEQRDLFEG